MERRVVTTIDQEAESTGSRGVDDMIRGSVGPNQRVLLIGHAVGPLARLLTYAQCAVVAVEGEADLALNTMPFCERVLAGDLEEIDLDRELGADRFDAVVLPDLETMSDPGALLAVVAPLLAPRGRIVASVLNGAHAGVRLALLYGELPTGSNTGRLPLYFRDSIEQLFQEANLDIAGLERCERAVDEALLDRRLLPGEVVDALMRDPEALTERFVVVARPRTVPELELIEHRLRKLTGERDAIGAALDRLSTVLDAQSGRTDVLEGALAEVRDHLLRHDAEVRDHLQWHDAGLTQVADELESRVETALRRGPGALSPDQSKQIRYEHVRHALRGVVGAAVPPKSIVMVISRGDDALLRLDGVEGWHFPRTNEGVYAGHHPADSQAAIAHFESLRARGGDFLVIPATSLWWLEYYAAFRDHLLASHQVVYRNASVGVIFAPRASYGGGSA